MVDVNVDLIEETLESNILQEEVNVSQTTDEVNVSTTSEDINVSVSQNEDINVSLTGINVDNTDHSSMYNLDYDNSGHIGFQEELIDGKGIDITGTTISTNLNDFTTTDLIEGTNLYYTEARVSANTDVVLNTTKISFDSISSTKLETIEEGAEVNVQSDWNATSGDSLILNKPTLYTSLNFDIDFGLKDTDDLIEGNNNLYDKTISFTGGTNVTIGGTYPNFIITDNSGISDLSLGETLTTAYRGDKGKIAYDHSKLISGNPHNVSLSDVGGTTDHAALSNLNSSTYSHLTFTQLSDLTDTGNTGLHYHLADRNRTNHTGTQVASTISDFDTEVSNNNDVTDNTAHRGLTNNPHFVNKTNVGLSNVPNVDTTNASNITTGTLSSSVLPPVALTTVQVVVNEAAQLALIAEEGDVAVRSDQNKSYMKNDGTSGSMADWTELQTPTDSVLSVNGEAGTVVLTTGDIGEDANHNYVTDAQLTVIENTSGTNTGDQSSVDFDHNSLINTHNLTTDIDHNQLTNYDVNKHFLQSAISIPASQISDFDTEVSNNTDVTANTTHKTSNGSDHSYINQDVTSSSSPSFQDIKVADKVYLDFSSNTYLKYNSSTQEVEIYVNGSIRASF